MSHCNKCGSVLVEGAIFCHQCGTKQNKYTLINKLQKITSSERNDTDRQATERISIKNVRRKKFVNPITIGLLAGLVAFLLGFASYYISLSLLSANNTKKTNTYTKLTPKPKNESTSNNADASADMNQSNVNEKDKDNSSNSIESRMNSNDGYIFTDSANKKLLDSDLISLNKEELALARNEIFARHGYVFETDPFKSYFNDKTWYKPNPTTKDNNEGLNDTEKYNIQLILKYEKR